MRNVIAPQQVVANADYPYGDRIARARELLERMGISDVKPLYSATGAGQRSTDEAAPATPARDAAVEAEPTFDTYWAGWALRTSQPDALVAGNDHDGGR